MRRRDFIAAAAAAVGVHASPASALHPLPMGPERLRELCRTSRAAGMACASQLKGKPAVIWTAGLRDKRGLQPIGEDDLWHLGSITKSMTATLAGRLVDKGLIAFGATVGEVLGERFPTMNPAFRDVTLWQLFTHRSGMLPDLDLGAIKGKPARFEVVQRALETKPIKRNDASVVSYSNIGVTTAGHMLEVRGGASWEDLMRQEVFRPLGLNSAGFGFPEGDQPRGETGGGLLIRIGRLSDPYLEAIGPAGNVHMSLPDTIAYLAAHRDGSALLRPETWDSLHSDPLKKGVAMGWGRTPDGSLIHSGSAGTFYALVKIDAPSGAVAIAVANRGGTEKPVAAALESAIASVT